MEKVLSERYIEAQLVRRELKHAPLRVPGFAVPAGMCKILIAIGVSVCFKLAGSNRTRWEMFECAVTAQKLREPKQSVEPKTELTVNRGKSAKN